MCGICGIVNLIESDPVDRMTIERMTDALAHRGPDADGFFCEDEVVFGHRRLAILDLSPAGRQQRRPGRPRYPELPQRRFAVEDP